MTDVPTRYLDIFVIGILINAYFLSAATTRRGLRGNFTFVAAGLFAIYFGGLSGRAWWVSLR